MSQAVSVSPRKMPTVKIATCAMFAALGVILSPLNPFLLFPPVVGSIPFPFAHMINAIAGVLLGPGYALISALIIAIFRSSTGFGTILAFPGGMCGALVVGLFQIILIRKKPKYVHYAALTEPIGTIFIGGTIASFIKILPFWTFWLGFAVSSIPGCILGWIILKILFRSGISATFLPTATKVSCEAAEPKDCLVEEKPAPP